MNVKNYMRNELTAIVSELKSKKNVNVNVLEMGSRLIMSVEYNNNVAKVYATIGNALALLKIMKEV